MAAVPACGARRGRPRRCRLCRVPPGAAPLGAERPGRLPGEPKCPHEAMPGGAGRSVGESLIILSSGWDFRMWVIVVTVVEIQRWLFMSLVMGEVHERMGGNIHCVRFGCFICRWFCGVFFKAVAYLWGGSG